MHRLLMRPTVAHEIHTTPEMTINEAAEAMERFHERHMLVGRDGRPVGVITEEDIVARVLARGLDPAVVHVSDVMLAGHVSKNGHFRVDEPGNAAPLWSAQTLDALADDETRVFAEVLEGRCEDCAVYSEELVDHEGLLMCPECTGFRVALFS